MRGFRLLGIGAWCLLATVSTSYAQSHSGPHIEDSDISAGAGIFSNAIPKNLQPDGQESYPNDSGFTVVEIVRVRDQQVLPVDGLPVELSSGGRELGIAYSWHGGLLSAACEEGQFLHGQIDLQTDKYKIQGAQGVYSVSFDVPCGLSTRVIFNSDSMGGQALGIWHIAYTAMFKLNQAVGLDFWSKSIKFQWPADADYYSWNTVHISRGDHWDVVGHELGHAIYDQADMGRSTGGEHYIDRCYSGTMALSEGWASYFSAWLSLDLNDSDAKFEFMVPRRAPIRLEHVPEDVCAGTSNEWRVSAFLWDLIDLNDDAEASQEAFAGIWQALAGRRSRDVSAVRTNLLAAGFDQASVDLVWLLNFGEEAMSSNSVTQTDF